MQQKSILIIEDNKDLANLLAMHLRDLNYSVELCFDGKTGLQSYQRNCFQLVILDLMLPKLDGLSVCKAIRAISTSTFILMLTAKDSEFDRVNGLEFGADDYVTKPFSIAELLARIKSIFRRIIATQKQPGIVSQQIIKKNTLLIELEKHSVSIDNHKVDLTSKEFELLVFFAKHPGRVFTRSELLDQIWGYGHDGYEHTVNSHINRLRLKIEKNPKSPSIIQTVWGVGYKFSE